MNEKQFYDALADVPEVPACAFENIERNVRRRGVKRRAALAACLLLAFIIPVLVLKHANTYTAYAEPYEAMEELQYAFDFLNGDDFGSSFLFDIDIGGADNGSAAHEIDVGVRELSATDTNTSTNVSTNIRNEGVR